MAGDGSCGPYAIGVSSGALLHADVVTSPLDAAGDAAARVVARELERHRHERAPAVVQRQVLGVRLAQLPQRDVARRHDVAAAASRLYGVSASRFGTAATRGGVFPHGSDP